MQHLSKKTKHSDSLSHWDSSPASGKCVNDHSRWKDVVKRMKCLKKRPRPVWTRPSSAHRRASAAEPWSTALVGEHTSAAESLGPLEAGSLGLFYFHQSTSCPAPNLHPEGTEEQPEDQNPRQRCQTKNRRWFLSAVLNEQRVNLIVKNMELLHITMKKSLLFNDFSSSVVVWLQLQFCLQQVNWTWIVESPCIQNEWCEDKLLVLI